jgi:TolA-binding protein
MAPQQVAGPDMATGMESFSSIRKPQPARRKAGKTQAERHASGGISPAMNSAPATPADGSYHAKALMAMESGDYREALQNLKRVLYMQPDSIIAHYLMGVALFSQDRRHAADKQFEMTHKLLASLKDEDIVAESDGLSAAFLRASVQAFLQKGNK